MLNRVSPSGRYVVFQDISGGIDSMLRVYSLEHNDTIQLDVFGTSDFTNLIQYSKNITLPDIGRDYFNLSVAEGKLRIYGMGGVNAGVLKQYNLDELLK